MAYTSLFNLISHATGGKDEFKLISKYQYRALEPAWPVVLSILFLALVFLAADQGRAIIRAAVSDPSLQAMSLTAVPLIIHSCAMMYIAFILSAVTRRNQIDSRTADSTSSRIDPIDPSIELRMRFAYVCGTALPMIFIIIALWFKMNFLSLEFALSVGFSVLCGFIYSAAAHWAWPILVRRVHSRRTNALAATGFGKLWNAASYNILRIFQFLTTPEHRLAQGCITALAALIVTVAWLSHSPGSLTDRWVNVLESGGVFFLCFFGVHIFYRYAKPRIVRLHHGHTARYIIVHHKVTRGFERARPFVVVLIIAALWKPDFVDLIGPLGVGLFGTLWLSLVFSWFVEGTARQTRTKSLKDGAGPERWTFKAKLLVFLIGLMMFELAITIAETWLYTENRVTVNVFVFAAVGSLIIYALQKKNRNISGALNKLPTPTLLAPILALTLGEAHHVHRIESQDSVVQAGSIDQHARAWLEARHDPDSDAPIPAIVILAEGGGIRAGAHAGLFLSHLDDQFVDWCINGSGEIRDESTCWESHQRLLQHTYSINGVSGGSIGSAVYLAAVNAERASQLSAKGRHDVIKETVGSDYLSHLFAGLFGSDIITTIVPIQLIDRAFGLFDRQRADFFNDKQPPRGMYDRADFFETRLTDVFHRKLLEFGSITSSEECGGKPLLIEQTFDRSLEDVAYCAGGERDLPLIWPEETISENSRPSEPVIDPGPMVFFSAFYENGGFQMATSNVDVIRPPKPPKTRSESADGEEENSEGLENCGAVPIVQQMLGAEHNSDGSNTWICDPVRKGQTRPKSTGGRHQTLPLSAAAHLSARFPVSNPTGVIETRDEHGAWKRHFFVDGGYMDNSGALTAIQSIEALRRAAKAHGAKIDIIVIHLYALRIPDSDGNSGNSQQANKQSELAAIPSAALKARGASSRAPIQMLCQSLHAEDDENQQRNCATIFERRSVSISKAKRSHTGLSFERAISNNRPTDRRLYEAINLRKEKKDLLCDETDLCEADGDGVGIRSATWIPIPLEVAASDRQKNAITALLGWSLLERTRNDIDAVMLGAAEFAFTDFKHLLPDDMSAEPEF